MKKYHPFKERLNQWTSPSIFKKEYRELIHQIKLLIEIQGGLGQTSQGNPENMDYRKVLIAEEKVLSESIRLALGL